MTHTIYTLHTHILRTYYTLHTHTHTVSITHTQRQHTHARMHKMRRYTHEHLHTHPYEPPMDEKAVDSPLMNDRAGFDPQCASIPLEAQYKSDSVQFNEKCMTKRSNLAAPSGERALFRTARTDISEKCLPDERDCFYTAPLPAAPGDDWAWPGAHCAPPPALNHGLTPAPHSRP